MPEKKTEASVAFSRTRADHAMEILEDYTEVISKIIKENGECRVMDLARYFGVSHVSVIQVLQRLTTNGFIESEARKPIILTEEGCALARTCANRHRIVRSFLLKIGVSEKTALIDSEGLEHHVSAETLECMKNFIAEH
ncbi:manganese-binding transcriptional regulator MntR [Treponema pectinovorum]|uniref:manganese-binding transcriptional regulator MntR n=1 Tax=Treponema pectinovorum TaxID=164 RepID=UPI0011C9870B|nr:manganese-binding transcriptional regulator MntR [Treponema pectinovorum]